MFRSFSKPDLPSDIDACFPFPTSPARIWFYSMVQKDARLIAAAVRWTIVGREPWPTDEVVQLSVVSENILKTFSDDQFKVIQGMEYMIDFANTLERNVCYIHGTSPRVSDQFHAAVPNMDKEFHNNFLPTVFRLLRKLVSCTGKSYERESTIVANSPKYMPFLRELIPKLLEQSLPVAESAVTPGSGSESQTQSNKLDSQTTIISSIATQEKLFFANFHNAAQQLSLLGIKAVGLATQIQAIRGHMMMLKLIDQHIGQLNGDHVKYTGLLEAALKQLETVTESSKTST
jgi:hypothetical protein